MASPNEPAAGRPKKAPSTKNMKRCPHCGAKNKDTFEYCVRCSESLEDEGGAWVESSERGSPMITIAAAALIGIVGLGALALLTGSSDEEPTPPVAANRATAPPAPAPERRGEPILVGIDSQEVLAVYNEGLRAFNQGDYDLAIEKLSEVVRDLPRNAAATRYLGLAYYHRGDLDDAIDTLGSARELRPDSFELLDNYVTACKEAGETEGALEALQGFVERHPDELDVRLEIARLARKTGNQELALAQSEFIATTDDADPEFVYEYGVTLKEAGQVEEAKTMLERAIELDPESAIAHHALGVTELATGNPAAALPSLEAAVARAPANGDYRFSLAQAYEKLDRVEDSLAAYDAYLEHASPEDQRAPVVRRQLEIAKEALAAEKRREREAEGGQSL